MELFISIIAILTSAISLYFSAYPVYLKYIRKAEKIVLTITDNKIESGNIKLCVVYSNMEYRRIIITNSFIMLTSSRLTNTYTYSNDVASKVWIEPIVFTGIGNKSIILKYALPELSDIAIDDVYIVVKTYYIDSKGKNRCNDFNVGQLVRTDNGAIVTYVEHIGHVLNGEEVIAALK